MLSNSSFIEKAPKAKVEQEQAKLVSYEKQKAEVIELIKHLQDA